MFEPTEATSRIYLNPGAIKVGAHIAEILRHAADKQAHVDDLHEKLLRQRSSGLGRIALQELENEFKYQQNKLFLRIGEADDIVAAGLEMRVINLEDDEVIAEGVLAKVNYHAGTLTVDCEEPHEVGYVSNVPAPEGVSQSYFGRKLTVGFEVKSVPKKNDRVIRFR